MQTLTFNCCLDVRKQAFPVMDEPFTVTLVRHGFMPTAPWYPELGISIEVLELYRILSNRCARLSVHSFTHSLCDLLAVSEVNIT